MNRFKGLLVASSWNNSLHSMKNTPNDAAIQKYANKMVIYRIHNVKDGKSYIGKCINGLTRVLDHLRAYKNPKQEYRARMLYRAMNCHGSESFVWEVLSECETLSDLDLKEIELIEKHNSSNVNFGYNLTKGGTGGNTWSKLTPEELAIGKKRASEASKKMHKDNPQIAKNASERMKKMRKDPAKTLKNSQIASKRMKLLNSTDSRFLNNRKSGIPHLCIETGVIYSSILGAAKNLGVGVYILRNRIRRNIPCNGFTFVRMGKK